MQDLEQTQNAANRAAEAAEAEQQAPLEAAISGSSGDIAAVDAPKEQHSEPATEPELEACASDASGDSKEAGGDALDHPVPDAEANETGDGDEDDPDESDFDDSETFEFDEESAQSMVAEVVFEGAPGEDPRDTLKAVIEGIIYITDEPLTVDQIAAALDQPADLIQELLSQLTEEYAAPDRGLTVRELAGGFKMGTKPEHHESIRKFVRRLQPPLKLSLAALETLAVVAYKQPVTGPEIMDIRGVQGLGVLKTLLDRKLIATAGRKDVIGKPILYKTTKEFLVQFGLSSLSELPTLKEFEELGRLSLADEPLTQDADATPSPVATPESEPAPEEAAEANTTEQQVEEVVSEKSEEAPLDADNRMTDPAASLVVPDSPEPEVHSEPASTEDSVKSSG